ncbi:uncharacterized protein (TIGR02413 family) [Evansella vedderi]|uniref:Uncharacterized protein (TIGR02413 family) n=1 Tax=Evansella vedderi TaxID=38282 RepID=A0ABT9ZZ68_9BACI|nr:YrzI family small protein [Evansella vedderi]MDQ0256528.1 uncharacterized protein (TIGR02413 family) [Evansella vedderi]
MMFHLFFLTITITKRKLTEQDIRREEAHKYYAQRQMESHRKHATHI